MGQGDGHQHIFERSKCRDQVVELKDKADVLPAQCRALGLVHAAGGLAQQVQLACRGVSSRPIRFSSVLLPEPELPVSAVKSLRCRRSDSPCSTCVSVGWPGACAFAQAVQA